MIPTPACYRTDRTNAGFKSGERMIFKRRIRHNWVAPILFGLSVLVFVSGTYGQTPTEAKQPGLTESGATPSAGIEELTRILVKNGLITKEQAEAIMLRKDEGSLSALAALTEILKTKGLISADDADRVSGKTAPGVSATELAASPGMKKEERDKMKAEIKDEVIQETNAKMQVAANPEWTKRIRFGGDIRLRYNGDYFPKDNDDIIKPDLSGIINSKNDRHRMLIRARLEATAQPDDQVEVGLRLSTGSTTNPVSTNQTMGTYFSPYSVVFDRAYLKWKPIPSFALVGGRFENPFFHSDLVWDPTVAFDGVAATYRKELPKKLLTGFATVGAFPLQELEFQQADKWLFGGQVGLETDPTENVSGKLGVAYYHYRNVQGVPNDPSSAAGETDFSSPLFQQKGNTWFYIDPLNSTKIGLASKFKELNITGTLDIGFWNPIHIVLLGDYVKNLGFDREEVAFLTSQDVKERTEGYQAGLAVGHPEVRDFGKWKVFGYYRYLGDDAILDAFADSTFHLGGTNAKGWILGGDFGLRKNMWASLKWVTTNEIWGQSFGIDSFFLDLNYKF